MRVGYMGVAAAALLAAGPAGAVSLQLIPSSVQPVITSGSTKTCPTLDPDPAKCTYGAVTLSPGLFDFVIGVPDLNGSYSFDGYTQAPGVYSGAFLFGGSVSFVKGNLISDVVNFTYRFNPPVSFPTYTSVEATGYYKDFLVRNLDTGQILAPVPEPATWALMLAGFGLVGFAMRRRKVTTRVAYA